MKTKINITILEILVNSSTLPLSIFPFETNFVSCRDRHLHITSFISTLEEENPPQSNIMSVSVSGERATNLVSMKCAPSLKKTSPRKRENPDQLLQNARVSERPCFEHSCVHGKIVI